MIVCMNKEKIGRSKKNKSLKDWGDTNVETSHNSIIKLDYFKFTYSFRSC